MPKINFFAVASAACLVAVAVFFGLPSGGNTHGHVVTVDTTQTFQTIRGWEVSDRVWQTDKKADRYDASWEDLGGPIFSTLVAEVGINNLRLQVPSGIENPVDNWLRFTSGDIGYEGMKSHLYEVVNDNADPAIVNPAGFQFHVLDQNVEHVLIPMRDALAAQNEQLYVTLTFVDFAWTAGRTQLQLSTNPAEYAEFILAVFQHLDRTKGVIPNALEIILEPENTDGWSGRNIGRAIVAVTERLAAAGYHPDIIAPSTTRAENAVRFFEGLSEVSGAQEQVDLLAYHRYGRRTLRVLPDIAAAARQAGIQTGMLEFISGNVDMLLDDLTIGNVSAWQQYGVARKIVDGDERASDSYYLDAYFEGNQFTRIELPVRTRLLAEIFRLFRAGSVRVATSSENAAIDAVAMRQPDGQHALALRISDQVAVTVNGMPPGTYILAGMGDDGVALSPQTVTITSGTPLQIPSAQPGVLTLRPTE